MKKQYTTPEIKVVNIDAIDIICASVDFGMGSTNIMNARDVDFDNDYDGLDQGLMWDE